jgi:dipeptidyl aminopeptidase/acylaminoacyl peptidase
MNPRRLSALLLLFVAAVAAPAHAQDFDLTIENIMRGPELVGESPGALRGGGGFFGGGVFDWSPDGRHVYFQWRQPGVDTAQVPYRVAVEGGEPERVTEREADTVLAGTAVWTRDGRRAIYVIDGDLIVWERGQRRQLTRTVAREGGAKWSSDESRIFFERDGNVFALTAETGALEQLTDIRRGDAPEDEERLSEQRRFLREQEERLIEFIGEERYKNQPWFRESERDTTRPKPFYPGANKTVQSLEITPDGQYALLSVVERARTTRVVDMPVWITPDGYVDIEEVRTKVGDAQSTVRAAILEVATGEVTYVGDSVGTGERDIRGVAVSPNSRHALLRIETNDDEQRWYAVVDVATHQTRVVDHLHDTAWLSGPSYFTAGFLPDGETIYFVSERTGWAHLYTVSATGGTAVPLTSGEWEVLRAELSRDGQTWYITANRDGFAEVHFYTMPATGGELRRITDTEGRQDVAVSPDGRWLAISHSEANKPPELYLQENRPGRTPRQVTVSTTEEWRSYDWIKPEIITFQARDGVGVPARLYRPRGTVAPSGQRPAVIFVHGAGYLQNVHNWWSNYHREYMFHHLLAESGYTVLDIDYRGSAGHGRDWRTAIYEHMGGKDLTDQVDGAQWLVDNMGVDPARIGLYGGSYGGFITLMAMFTTPNVFEAGAALRPVTDWAHYNHGYTSNILNEPQNDSLAYQRSSPIYFADGLEGHLLIAHGMVDDNVHFSDTVRLVQRLIELGKDNWEVAIYPAERHGFTEPASWTDEYKRIFKLFEGALK